MPTMPNLIGFSIDYAAGILSGLNVIPAYEYKTIAPPFMTPGIIMGQFPDSGIPIHNATAAFSTPPLNGAVITWTDNIHAIPQSMGIGDGSTTSFYFLINNLPYTPLNPNVYISDWEGNQLQYTTPRTNYCGYSQDSSKWILSGVTQTNNNAGAPDGTATLNRIIQDTSNGNHRVLANAISGTAAKGQYSCRIYISQGTASYCELRFTDNNSGYCSAIFSFLTNSIISTSVTGAWTNALFSSFAHDNGFYTIVITANDGDGTTQIGANVFHYNGSTESFIGDGATYFNLWGVYITTSSVLGSYIKTTGAAVTNTDYSYSVLLNNVVLTIPGALALSGRTVFSQPANLISPIVGP